MARLPDYLTEESHHISRRGDHLVVTITADASKFVAALKNLGPAWDRLDRWARRWHGSQRRHHIPERADRSAMHAAYDRRRRGLTEGTVRDLDAFLTSMVGKPIALVGERPMPKITGTLVDVLPMHDEHDPVLVVQADDRQHAVAFGLCCRLKFHFTPTDKDRR